MVRTPVCGTGDGSSILLLAPKELVAQLARDLGRWFESTSVPAKPFGVKWKPDPAHEFMSTLNSTNTYRDMVVRVDPPHSALVQWLERLPVTQEVTGSSPVCTAIGGVGELVKPPHC